MTFTVLIDSRHRIVKLPQRLATLLGLEQSKGHQELAWQSIVVEDAAKLLPSEAGKSLQRSAYLKQSSGSIVGASIACERLDLPVELYCVDISITGEGEDSTEPVDRGSLDFLTTVSHELRNALNGVIGFSNILGGTRLEPEQQALVDKLNSCNHLLKGLINDILEYSRVATSKIDFRSEAVNVDYLVHEVVGLFRDRARNKGLEIRLEVGSDANELALLPRLRVTQVLSNLIANAIKFTSRGWITVRVSCTGGKLRIGVQDTGSGIGVGRENDVFKPFFQMEGKESDSEGTGLGLAISKELAIRMGGSLVLRQPNEGGSLFELTLPLRGGAGSGKSAVRAHEGDRTEKSQTDEVKRSGGKHVLIVEDNQLNADILSHFLKDYGASFDHVDNGRSAVEVYRDGKYDLILMDVMLPEMDGYMATQKILAQTRLNPPVPIVGVTAKVFRRDQVRCIEAGMVEVVHKPVDFKQLRSVLDQYLYSEPRGEASSAVQPQAVAVPVKSSARTEPRTPPASMASGNIDASILEAYMDRMSSPDTSREEVLSTALGIVDAEVASLLDSIEEGNRKDIEMRAHSLKGALALLGARNMLDLAKGLELVAGDGRSPLKCEHWKELISDAYRGFRGALDAYLASRAPQDEKARNDA